MPVVHFLGSDLIAQLSAITAIQLISPDPLDTNGSWSLLVWFGSQVPSEIDFASYDDALAALTSIRSAMIKPNQAPDELLVLPDGSDELGPQPDKVDPAYPHYYARNEFQLYRVSTKGAPPEVFLNAFTQSIVFTSENSLRQSATRISAKQAQRLQRRRKI